MYVDASSLSLSSRVFSLFPCPLSLSDALCSKWTHNTVEKMGGWRKFYSNRAKEMHLQCQVCRLSEFLLSPVVLRYIRILTSHTHVSSFLRLAPSPLLTSGSPRYTHAHTHTHQCIHALAFSICTYIIYIHACRLAFPRFDVLIFSTVISHILVVWMSHDNFSQGEIIWENVVGSFLPISDHPYKQERTWRELHAQHTATLAISSLD